MERQKLRQQCIYIYTIFRCRKIDVNDNKEQECECTALL